MVVLAIFRWVIIFCIVVVKHFFYCTLKLNLITIISIVNIYKVLSMGFGNHIKKLFKSNKKENKIINDDIIESIEIDDNKPFYNGGFVDETQQNKLKNFKYLDDLIHGSIKIVLDADIVLDDDEEFYYKEGINLDIDDLIIDGDGHYIDARRKTRIFNCTGKNILLRNIKFKNGFSKENGGAIFIDYGELSIMESTFNENKSQEYAGAVYNDKGILNISNSTFNENSSSMNAGAIFNNMGTSNIIGSTFNENSSKHDGGAIGNYSGEFSITDSTFNKNVSDDGGAIKNSGNIDITDSRFNENHAIKCGGVIYNDFGHFTINNATFQGNSSTRDGGAIFIGHGSELRIMKSTFTGNISKIHYGGAIYNENGSLSIFKSTFDDNESVEGGAIVNENGNFKIFGCEFLNNNSLYVIIKNMDFLQIYDSNFIANHAKKILDNDEKSVLSIFNGEFKDNDVSESLIFNNGKSCVIERTLFENDISYNIINQSELNLLNPKIGNGGKTILNEGIIFIKNLSPNILERIYGEGAVEDVFDIVPDGDKFDFGYLDKLIRECNGRKIVLDHDVCLEKYEQSFYEGGIELDIDNLVIDGNGKTIDGVDKSRIFIITGKNITLRNIIFKNGHSHKNYDNSFNSHGGAIKINHNLDLRVENCKFINNNSEDDGGAIYNNGGKLAVIESMLSENTANSYGGAIDNNGGMLLISDSRFDGNTVNENHSCGGAIHSEGTMEINRTSLKKNAVNGKYSCGGAIHSTGVLKITQSVLSENAVDYQELYCHGGAIYFNGKLTITESILNENTARDGGAINVDHGSELRITKSEFSGNTSVDSGGAINNWGFSTIIHSRLYENKAGCGGGAICNCPGGQLNVSASVINNNTASEKYGGGAVYNNRGACTLTECDINYNEPNNVFEN